MFQINFLYVHNHRDLIILHYYLEFLNGHRNIMYELDPIKRTKADLCIG